MSCSSSLIRLELAILAASKCLILNDTSTVHVWKDVVDETDTNGTEIIGIVFFYESIGYILWDQLVQDYCNSSA